MGEVVGFCLKEPIPIAVIFEGLSTCVAEEPPDSNAPTPPDGDLIDRGVVTEGEGGPLVELVELLPSLVTSRFEMRLVTWFIFEAFFDSEVCISVYRPLEQTSDSHHLTQF